MHMAYFQWNYHCGIVNFMLCGGIARVIAPAYFGDIMHMPGILTTPVGWSARKSIMKAANGHGYGRHTEQELAEKLSIEIHAVSTFLGEKTYILGDRPCSFDATVYGYLAPLIQFELAHPLCELVRSLPNLMAYIARMRTEVFPELQAAVSSEDVGKIPSDGE
eukprot:m.500334 g.500334  ORF g.500334 m.500334 type:complete len:163 (-) comp21833_c0_seq7:278-766(-)